MSNMARIQEDLGDSGLEPADMGIRILDNAERAATSVPHAIQGYVIPYYDMYGKPVQFYRVKLFDYEPKYKQPKDTASHIYFPKGWLALADKSDYIILTEGEKKAAMATKLGFPAVSVGGTESWRNRIFTIPVDSELTSTDKSVRARLPSGTEVKEDFMSPLAIGLQGLIDYCISHNKHFVICYDNDVKASAMFNTQRAAASLGYELRFKGIGYNRIRQIRLPLIGREKIGLDDYLMEVSPTEFKSVIQVNKKQRSTFPRHPNVRDYVNKRLQSSKMSRKEMQQVSMAILCELDAGGIRLRSKQTLQSYYFDFETRKLLLAGFPSNASEITESPFGHYLYRRYGIGGADQRLLTWLGTQFTGEDPVEEVNPYRVLARHSSSADKVMLQISDGQYIEISGDDDNTETPGLSIINNGESGVLFEAEQVEALNTDKLIAEYTRQYKEPLNMWWGDVLSQVRLKDKNKQRFLTALLFYISPWLNRWRGTQLPIEMTIGEAGSGKSTLQELRLNIITGKPKLRNAPHDMKDWSASVTSTGGIHVIDNLQLPDRNMRQRLSDEICRIITEPAPSIEMRKYYTNADLIYLPVHCAFGITAIKQPFLNSDVLARAIVIELDKSLDLVNGNLSYDSNWMQTQLQRFGGREAWIAHHALVLHHFFRKVSERWNMKYKAHHRLINLEQSLVLMAEVFGLDGSWIPNYLQGVTTAAVTDADWAFEGLITFCSQRANHKQFGRDHTFGAQEISNWAMGMEEYEKCEELTNSRRIGRYLNTHKTLLASVCGMVEGGTQNNRKIYYLTPKQPTE